MLLDATKRWFLLLPLLAALAACSEESDEETYAEPAPDCQAIGDACTHDVTGELAEECHEVYHHNDAGECGLRREECVDFCTSPLGEGGGSGAGN
ncbi:MAG TPA: hypothetical protein VFU02_16640 [Polyangiaceae bacterium]|nr:hypothetical protein [Polyangiaceae bacterium]